MTSSTEDVPEFVLAFDEAFARACAILAGTTVISELFIAAARTALENELGHEAVDEMVAAVNSSTGEPTLPPKLECVARKLLIILYTGQIKRRDAPAQATFYQSALAWQMLDFADAPGICGFGSWSRKAST